ncbi:MAG: peptidoglycan-binding domain-containing protein [Candidatus Saccharibacteria bacterium]|nr:peptidoglycan-binding domain-containing protein [Candidatus Saccharibacteria bacterium]
MNVKTIMLAGLAAVSLGAAVVLFNPAPAEAANWNCTNHLYRRGSRGGCVWALQKFYNYQRQAEARANGRYIGPAIAEDGVFGPATARAIHSFQRSKGLAADGIVGNQTWRVLCKPPIGAGEPGALYVLRGDFSLELGRKAGCGKYGSYSSYRYL